jgi:heme oxygenase
MALCCTAVQTRRFRLREGIHAAHARLADGIGTSGFLENRADFGVYLQASFRAPQPIEAPSYESGTQTVFTAWPSRRTADHLPAGLADLGGQLPDSLTVARLHMPSSKILATLYVLEGSALGAKLLSRPARRLGMSATLGARHMQAQTSDAGVWRRFLDVLERHPMTPDEEVLCDCAARRTFDAFTDELLYPEAFNADAWQVRPSCSRNDLCRFIIFATSAKLTLKASLPVGTAMRASGWVSGSLDPRVLCALEAL